MIGKKAEMGIKARARRAAATFRRKRVTRVQTSSGQIRFFGGTLWLQPSDMALRRLQEFHRAAIGWRRGLQLVAAAKAKPAVARTVYHHAVTCFLGQYIASHDRDRLALFSTALSFIEASWSFDGMESVFHSGMNTARGAGCSDLVRRGNILRRRIGPPRQVGGGFDRAPVYDSVTNRIRFIGAGVMAARVLPGGLPSLPNPKPSDSAAADDAKQQAAHERHLKWAASIVGAAGSFAAARGWGLALSLVKGTWLEPQKVSNDEVTQRMQDDRVAKAIDALGEFVAVALLAPLAAEIVAKLEDAGVLAKVDAMVDAATAIKDDFVSAADDVKTVLLDGFQQALSDLQTSINGIATALANDVGTAIGVAAEALNEALGELDDELGGMGDEALVGAADLIGAMGDAAGSLFSAVSQGIGDGVGFVMAALGVGSSESQTSATDSADSGTDGSTSSDDTDNSGDDSTPEPVDDDEPEPDDVRSEEPQTPPGGDSGYPNPDSDNPYTGGGSNPYASDFCPTGLGLLSLVSYSDGDFGCGNVPRLGPGGMRINELGFLHAVPLLNQEYQDGRSRNRDPSPIGDVWKGSGSLDPRRIDPGYIDPISIERAVAIQLILRLLR